MTSIIRSIRSLLTCLICLAVFLAIVSGVSIAATAPETAWEKNYGSAEYVDTGASVWQTSDCGFIITGLTYSKGPSSGITRVMLVKTDWQGNEVWTKYYDDGKEGKFVRQTSDGGYIVVGSASGSLYVLKTDGNGEKEWSQVYPRPNGKTIVGEAIQQTPDGGYIVAGSINVGGPQGTDMYVARLDSNGNKLWENSYGGVDGQIGTGVDNCYSIWLTTDSGYILGGTSWSWDYWPKAALVKIDATGKQEWFKVYNETDARMDGSSVEVQQTRDGGFIYAGYKSGKTCLLKADASGKEQWNKTYDGFQASSVQQTWDDGYVFTDARSGLVTRTDSAGNVLWKKTLTGLGLLEGASVQQIGNGSYVIAGLTKAENKASDNFYLGQLDRDFTPVPNAQLTSSRNALQMEAGGTYTITVTFMNNGTMPWTFQDGTWMAPVGGSSGDAALFGITTNYTIPYGSVIRPGHGLKMDYTVKAPEMNGTYYPEVRMFRENHGWFGEPGRTTIIVVNGTPDTRTPTAVPTAEATAKPTAQVTANPTQAGTVTEKPVTTATGDKSGLPCLSSVVLPLLLVGTVGVGLYRRRNK